MIDKTNTVRIYFLAKSMSSTIQKRTELKKEIGFFLPLVQRCMVTDVAWE
jgi:hypothetical protein